MPKRVVVYGVPSAAGAFTDSPALAPAALRTAGLIRALEAHGVDVVDRGDSERFGAVEDPEHPTCRNVSGVANAIRATADATAAAVREGFAVMLGGDCSLVAGLVAGTRRHVGSPVGLIYLDAHGDLNTPQTTPSGRICGMALAVALGHGELTLVKAAEAPAIDPARTVLLGFRELDPGERKLIEGVGLTQDASEVLRTGPEAAADLALRIADSAPLVVHFDVDIIDASEMSTHIPAALGHGLSRTEAGALLRRLVRAPRVAALGISGFDAERDPDGHHARALVELLAGALSPGD